MTLFRSCCFSSAKYTAAGRAAIGDSLRGGDNRCSLIVVTVNSIESSSTTVLSAMIEEPAREQSVVRPYLCRLFRLIVYDDRAIRSEHGLHRVVEHAGVRLTSGLGLPPNREQRMKIRVKGEQTTSLHSGLRPAAAFVLSVLANHDSRLIGDADGAVSLYCQSARRSEAA